MDTAQLDVGPSVLQRTEEFIEALRATPAIRRFKEASRRFEADQEVQSLLGRLQRFQQAQQRGTATSTEVQDARDAQARIQRHPLVREFLAARNGAGALFLQTNQAISEVMGIDFGQTAGPAGGAC